MLTAEQEAWSYLYLGSIIKVLFNELLENAAHTTVENDWKLLAISY